MIEHLSLSQDMLVAAYFYLFNQYKCAVNAIKAKSDTN